MGISITDDYKDSTAKEQERSEQDLINKDRCEIDLLSVLSTNSQRVVFQAETKSNTQDTSVTVLRKDIKKAEKQLEHLKDYLQRMHGSEVQNSCYLPSVALPNIPKSLLVRSFCLCNLPVAEIEISESPFELDPPDAGDLGLRRYFAVSFYAGKKYQICRIRNKGRGCSFFKWDCDDDPMSSSDSNTGYCECDLAILPMTVTVPPQGPGRQNPRMVETKKFQLCPMNGCDFFRWLDLSQTPPPPSMQNAIALEMTLLHSCPKHFIFREHVSKQEKQRLWWEKNTREHRDNNILDISETFGRLFIAADSLSMRLLTIASMAFTQIPRLLSSEGPDSILVLMR